LLLGLVFAGVLTSDTLRKRRRLAWFLLIVISAVVTPTVDPITPLALAIPLAFLYEATILHGPDVQALSRASAMRSSRDNPRARRYPGGVAVHMV